MDKATMELHDSAMKEFISKIKELDPTSEECTKAVNNAMKLNTIMVNDRQWKMDDQKRIDEQALKDEEFEFKKKVFETENEQKIAEFEFKKTSFETEKEQKEKELLLKEDELDLKKVSLITDKHNKESELELKKNSLEADIAHHKGNRDDQKLFKIIDVSLTIVGIVLPMIFYNDQRQKLQFFEMNGYLPTSGIFRNFINKLSWKK